MQAFYGLHIPCFHRRDTTKLYFTTRRAVAVAAGATIKFLLMREVKIKVDDDPAIRLWMCMYPCVTEEFSLASGETRNQLTQGSEKQIENLLLPLPLPLPPLNSGRVANCDFASLSVDEARRAVTVPANAHAQAGATLL